MTADHGHHLRPPHDGTPHQQVRPPLRHGLAAHAVLLRHPRHAPGQLLGILHCVPLHHRLQPVLLRALPVLDLRHVHGAPGRQRQRALRRLGQPGELTSAFSLPTALAGL